MYKLTITNRLGITTVRQADDYTLVGDNTIRLYDLVKGDDLGEVVQLDKKKITSIHEYISLEIAEV